VSTAPSAPRYAKLVCSARAKLCLPDAYQRVFLSKHEPATAIRKYEIESRVDPNNSNTDGSLSGSCTGEYAGSLDWREYY